MVVQSLYYMYVCTLCPPTLEASRSLQCVSAQRWSGGEGGGSQVEEDKRGGQGTEVEDQGPVKTGKNNVCVWCASLCDCGAYGKSVLYVYMWWHC